MNGPPNEPPSIERAVAGLVNVDVKHELSELRNGLDAAVQLMLTTRTELTSAASNSGRLADELTSMRVEFDVLRRKHIELTGKIDTLIIYLHEVGRHLGMNPHG